MNKESIKRHSMALRSWLLLPVLFVAMGCGSESQQEESARPQPLLTQGMYDFYGAFSDNPQYADGTGTCAIPAPLGCPSVTSFCIYSLEVSSPGEDGVQEISGCSEDPASSSYDPQCQSNHWNVAVGKVWMMPFVLSDWDGGGQVVGKLDTLGGRINSISDTSMVVEKEPGILPSWNITSWSTSLEGPPDPTPGTMILTIPYQNNLKPPPPEGSPPGTYSPPASTTARAASHITNPESGEVSREASGTPLQSSMVRLVTPFSILRTIIAIVPMGSDVNSITAWDGTFCKRSDPGESCVPEDFTCPDLND